MGKQGRRLDKYVDWALMALLSGIATYATNKVSAMSASIDTLNQNVAVVITKADDQGKAIDDLKERVRALETLRRMGRR